MFDRMEITEQVYKGKSPSKYVIRADDNRDGHVRKQKGGEAASPAHPDKGHSGKRKTINTVSPSDTMNGAEKHYCCMSPDTPLSSVKP